jgi:endonuclease YncB( thermonuclease family)
VLTDFVDGAGSSPSRLQKRYTAEADYSSDCFSLEEGTSFIVPADHAEAKPALRLEGTDAPETDQICLNAKGDHWACGIEARDSLLSKTSAV